MLREVQAGKSVVRVAREHELHLNPIGKCQTLPAQNAFQGSRQAYTQEAKFGELERLISQ